MDPSNYCGKSRGYKPASSSHENQGQPGRPAASSPGTRGSFPQEERCDYGQRPLHQRSPQRYPLYPQASEQDDIDKAFALLRTDPWHALDTAEFLLDRYGAHPSGCVRIFQLKARALFQLNKIDDCIAFINALDPGVRESKGLLMAKARALQTRGCFHEALPLFQHLYDKYQVTCKDHKTHGLALGRLLQLMGGANNLDKALIIFTQLRTRTAEGRVHTPCDDKDIELALGRLYQEQGGADNLQRALAIYTRLRTWSAGGRVNTPCDDKDIELTLGRHLQLMGGADNLQQGLAIFARLRYRSAGRKMNTPCNDKDIELTLGRHLELMGGANNLQKALAIYTRLRTLAAGGRTNTPCDDKEIEMTLGRCLQLMRGTDNLEKARAIFTRLRTWRVGGRINTPCDDKEIELALGRLLQIMGGSDNLQQALAIFTRLRTRAAGGRVNIPCDDKEIELSLGRHLQLVGGSDNLQQALAIFTRLRTRAAGGRVNVPCDDKEIELALGRLYQSLGRADHLEEALTIYTRLRTVSAGRRMNTPCDDKDIELTLGKHLQLMGGSDNLKKALAIYTRLRTKAAGGHTNRPCHDKDIELALARLLVDMQLWPQFDELHIEVRRFPGFESHLSLSIRYFAQLLATRSIASGHLRLLGQAITSVVLAMEAGGLMNASCLSQLAHCLRLLSGWPDILLRERGMQRKDVRSLSTAAKLLFDTADTIAPCRQRMEKDQCWREKEKQLLTLLSRQHRHAGCSIR